jgi:hypothetical protein
LAGEIYWEGSAGFAYKAVLRDPAGLVWNGAAFGIWSDGAVGSYGMAMTGQGASGHFRTDFPPAITTPGRYSWTIYEQNIAAALQLTDIKAGAGYTDWDGTGESNASDLIGALFGRLIETGVTFEQLCRGLGAMLLGDTEDAGTSAEKFKAAGNPATVRVTADPVTSAGERTMTLELG